MKKITPLRFALNVLMFFAVTAAFIACETSQTAQNEFTPLATESQIDSVYQQQADTNAYSNSANWTDAQVEAHWKKLGY